jgi:exodeoxyribonuclease VII large subunit
VLTRRNPRISILLYPVKVQGEGAAREIAAAIEEMNRFHDIDTLIVGRGGGSIEDLWAFNEECVARAIYASRIPVVSAVGHEVDFTIADFVADARAPTPSAAAEIVAPVLRDTVADLRRLTLDMVSLLRGRVESRRDILRTCIDRRFFREPMQIVGPAAQRVDDLNHRLGRALDRWVVSRKERLGQKIRQLFQASPERPIRLFRERVADMHPRLLRALDRWAILGKQQVEGKINRLFQASPGKTVALLMDKQAALERRLTRQMHAFLQLRRESFEGAARNLNALGPLRILDRGYSICSAKATGKAIKSSAEVQAGETVEVRLARGKLDCIVDKTAE